MVLTLWQPWGAVGALQNQPRLGANEQRWTPFSACASEAASLTVPTTACCRHPGLAFTELFLLIRPYGAPEGRAKGTLCPFTEANTEAQAWGFLPEPELPSSQMGCWCLSEEARTLRPCEGTREVLVGGVGGAARGGPR